jgi:hypothetical protein
MSSSVSAVGDKPTAARLLAERQKRRIDAEVKRKLRTADELYESFDPRGWNSQKGQALLDLMYGMVTQMAADIADLKGQLLDLAVENRPRPVSDAEAERRRAAKLERLQRFVKARQEHPDMTLKQLGDVLGVSDTTVSIALGEAKAMGVKADATARD